MITKPSNHLFAVYHRSAHTNQNKVKTNKKHKFLTWYVSLTYSNSPPHHRKHSLNHSLHKTCPTIVRISGAKTKKQKRTPNFETPISYRRPLNLSNGNRAHGPVSRHVVLLVYRYFFPFEVDDMTNFKHHYPPPSLASRDPFHPPTTRLLNAVRLSSGLSSSIPCTPPPPRQGSKRAYICIRAYPDWT